MSASSTRLFVNGLENRPDSSGLQTESYGQLSTRMVFESLAVIEGYRGPRKLVDRTFQNNRVVGFNGFITALFHMSLKLVQSSWPSTNANFGSR